MSGEHHESGERDRRDDPDNGSRTLDELSREDILRALASLTNDSRPTRKTPTPSWPG